MTQPIRVVFVCLGNICRSPLAEGAFRQHVITAGLADHFDIDSAGTSGYHAGELPDRRSIEIARQNGVDITSQRSRAFVKGDLDRFDYVIAMDASNRRNMLRLASSDEELDKLTLFRRWDASSPEGAEVPDPYYGGDAGFTEVFDICMAASRGLLAAIRERHGF